jgi:hypothetical protein
MFLHGDSVNKLLISLSHSHMFIKIEFVLEFVSQNGGKRKKLIKSKNKVKQMSPETL